MSRTWLTHQIIIETFPSTTGFWTQVPLPTSALHVIHLPNSILLPTQLFKVLEMIQSQHKDNMGL